MQFSKRKMSFLANKQTNHTIKKIEMPNVAEIVDLTEITVTAAIASRQDSH